MRLNIPKLMYKAIVNVAHKLGAYEERVDRYFNVFKQYISSSGVALDLGCGPGTFSRLLAKDGHFVIALDIDCEVLKQIPTESNIARICADAQNLPLRNNSIDYALSISLIEHLPNPEEHLLEVYRVLKKGGLFVVQLPNLQYFIEPHTKWPLLFMFPRRIQHLILQSLNYAYVNMYVTIKYFLELTYKTGFILQKSSKYIIMNY